MTATTTAKRTPGGFLVVGGPTVAIDLGGIRFLTDPTFDPPTDYGLLMVAGSVILDELASSRPHLVGWAYGGVGAGIALSGLLMAIVTNVGDWSAAWWTAALLTAVLLAVGWNVGTTGPASTTPPQPPARSSAERPRHRPWFVLLSISYFLEGAGYIVAGTFLVAAFTAAGPDWLGHSAWTIVGIAVVLPAPSGPTSRPASHAPLSSPRPCSLKRWGSPCPR